MEPGLLLIPGPVPLAPRVLEEFAKPAMPHYGDAWVKAHRETREMLVPFNASGEAAAPVARLAKAALERGLYLMTHWNVIMICPPLTITREELDEGIAILDDVLSIADEYYI